MNRSAIPLAFISGMWLAFDVVAAQAAPCLIVTLTGTAGGPQQPFNGLASAGTLVRYGDEANNCGILNLQFDAGRGTTMKLSQLGVGTEQLNSIFFTHMHSDHTEGFVTRFDRERGRDPGLYYLRVFGNPGSGTWGWRFGGHHVSLNNLIVDGEVVSTTPCFMGADPASSELLGGAVNRPLARVEDLARELVRSLSPTSPAVRSSRPRRPPTW